MKLLLIENDEGISKMLQDFLESEAFEVTAALDGEERWMRFLEDT